MSTNHSEVSIDGLDVAAFTIPTSSPEADGTLAWNETTIVTVSVTAGGLCGLGYTYADVSTAHLIDSVLKPVVLRQTCVRTCEAWIAMRRRIRNLGHPGNCLM